MIFVTGPRFSGKKTYLCRTLHLSEEELSARAALEVQERVTEEDPAELAETLARYEIVTASETGCGVVPASRKEREQREAAGRLCCLLADRAEVVIRLCCGLPEVLKGNWPH